MSFRDDSDAILSRLAALDARVASHDQELASRDEALVAAQARIAELEAEVSDLQRALGDSESTLRDLRSQRGLGKMPVEVSYVRGSTQAQAEADRCLAEGIALHNAGDRHEATRRFTRGLDAVPGHPELLRALRRYT